MCNLLNLLYTINRKNRKLNYKEFYNEAVNSNEELKRVTWLLERL